MKNILKSLGLRKLLQVSTLIIGATIGLSAQAATSVAWTSPADGSTYPTGTTETLTGVAGASGIIGQGLDLILVLDSSGSMGATITSGGVSKTLRDWQKDAAIALVNSLPSGTAVGIVEFDSSARLVTGLKSLSTDLATVLAAINATDSSGGTNIPTGINVAVAELIGPNAKPNASQQMVVFSDGFTSGLPNIAAANAIAAGVEAIHTIALPGSSIVTMQGIATNGNGTLVDARDGNLSGLISLFSGSGVSLVGLDRVEVTLPNGSVILVAADAFGNFNMDAVIASGANTFVATAFGTDGSMASDTITLFGVNNNVNPVPVPASLPLLAFGLLGFAAIRRKLAKKK